MATSKNHPSIDESKLLIKAAQTTMVLVLATLSLLPWAFVCFGDYTKNIVVLVLGPCLLAIYMMVAGIKAKELTPLQKIGATLGGIISVPAWVAVRLVSWLFSLPM